MSLTGSRTFVGLGFGAVQAGLFLYEAFLSGEFERLVVAEVVPEAVAALRRANGMYTVNVAHADRIEPVQIGPVEICNPLDAGDRARLVEAIAQAAELSTAVPTIRHYAVPGPESPHRLLAQGLLRKIAQNGPRAVVYAAENHNRAAAILQTHVMGEIPQAQRAALEANVRFLDTVIGKMGGVLPVEADLAPVTPGGDRAFLVEAFNRIQVSRISFANGDTEPPFRRGIRVFVEKDNLEPFEVVKLYGHNAVHALAAYTGAVRGVERIADLRGLPGVLPFLRAALVQESGAALLRQYSGEDAYFTEAEYERSADDLMARMVNPYLQDTVARVGRDPERKLAWDDRLIGAMRLCHFLGIAPRRYAFGAAAALFMIDPDAAPETILLPLWRSTALDAQEVQVMLDLVATGRQRLDYWRATGFGNLERLFS